MKLLRHMVAAVLCFAIALACDSEPDSAAVPQTGDEIVDEIVTAILNDDAEVATRYWDWPELPCVPPGEGSPGCPDGVETGTPIKQGIYNCIGRGSLRFEDSEFGLSSQWNVYSVELDDSVGLTYRLILSPDSNPDKKAIELYVRTPKPGLEDVFDPSFRSYSKLCVTAREATEGVATFLIPPPDLR